MTKKIAAISLLSVLSVSIFLYARYRVAPEMNTFDVEYMLDGQKATLNSLQGQNVVVSFYASWCGTCLREFPHLIEAHSTLKEEGFVFIGLTDDVPEKIEKIAGHFQVPFGLHKLTSSLKENGIYSLPTTYILNAKGEVVFKKVEEVDWSSAAFIQEIRELVQ
jgi:thiol-disulfide isomerase/thioredoxin